MLILECPWCHDCHDVLIWNEQLKNSILVGRAEELIPETVQDYTDWNNYTHEHEGSLVDCPSCGEVCTFEDINAV